MTFLMTHRLACRTLHPNVLRRTPLQLQHTAAPVRPHTRNLSVRASDSNNKQPESEPDGGLVGIIKGAVKGIQDAVQGLVGGSKLARQEQQKEREMDRMIKSGMPGGVVGWAMGGLLKSAIKMLGTQVEAVAKENEMVMREATQRIRSSGRLRRRLGENIVVGPPMSQSSSSVSINGRSTQRSVFVVPIQGSSGIRAQAQVSYSNMQKEGPVYDIIAFLPDGQIQLGGEEDDEFPGGRTIDVEFKDVK